MMVAVICLLLVAGILVNVLITGFSTLNVIYLVLSSILLVIHVPSINRKIVPDGDARKRLKINGIIYGVFFVLVIMSGILMSPYKEETKYYQQLEQVTKLIRSEKYTRAETVLLDLYGKDNKDVNVILQLGILYMSQDRYEESWEYLYDAYKYMPYDMDILYNMAINRYRFGDYKNDDRLKEEALTYLERIFEFSPDIAKTQVYAGQICMELGRYKQGEYYLENAVRLEPENPVIYYYMAKKSIDLTEYDRAQDIILKAKGLKPEKQLEDKLDKLMEEIPGGVVNE